MSTYERKEDKFRIEEDFIKALVEDAVQKEGEM